MVAAGYALIRRKRGARPFLEDSAFRSNLVSVAASGMSRRGVAAMVGISHETLCDWLARGKAEPDVEPYGSFAVDYQRASRALEAHASGAVALTAKKLFQLCSQERWAELAEMGPQMKELLNVLAHRYPDDWGASAHRIPEKDPDPNAWLERHAITHGQLVAILSEPHEVMDAALKEALPAILARLTPRPEPAP